MVEDATSPDQSPFLIDASGNVGIGTSSPAAKLEVTGGISYFTHGAGTGALRVGADVNTSVLTPSVRKVGRITTPSFDAGATNTFLVSGNNDIGVNGVYIGGYSGGTQYAATTIGLFTAANTTTTGGTERMTIDSDGDVGIGSTTPYAKLSITNTGSGPSFVVEDATSADQSPFVIQANGFTAIGTTTTNSILSVVGGYAASEGQMFVHQNGAGNNPTLH